MYFAYILKSETRPDELYRGHTSDIEERLKAHNAGDCRHTKKWRPWSIVFYAAFPTLSQAQDFERYLKSGSGHAFAKKHLLV